MQTERREAANLQTNSTDCGREFAGRLSALTIAIYHYQPFNECRQHLVIRPTSPLRRACISRKSVHSPLICGLIHSAQRLTEITTHQPLREQHGRQSVYNIVGVRANGDVPRLRGVGFLGRGYSPPHQLGICGCGESSPLESAVKNVLQSHSWCRLC